MNLLGKPECPENYVYFLYLEGQIVNYKTALFWSSINTQFFVCNPFGAKTGIFCKNQDNTMAADTLTPCITRTSFTMVLAV